MAVRKPTEVNAWLAKAWPAASPVVPRNSSRPSWRIVRLAGPGSAQYQRAGAFQTAQHHSDHEGACGRAEGEGDPAGQRNADQADGQAERQADAEGERVDLADASLRVAEELADRGELAPGDHDAYAIAQFERQVVTSEQVQVAPSDPGDDAAEAVIEVESGHGTPGGLPVGDDEAAIVDLAPVVCEVLIHAVAEVGPRPAYCLSGPDHHHAIADLERFVGADDPGLAIAPEIGEQHRTIRESRHLLQRARPGYLHADIDQPHARGWRRIVASRPLQAEDDGDYRDRHEHADRVGDRIADGRFLGADQFRRRGERRSRGEGARERAG